jgi:hypothetical protein
MEPTATSCLILRVIDAETVVFPLKMNSIDATILRMSFARFKAHTNLQDKRDYDFDDNGRSDGRVHKFCQFCR